MRFNDVSVQVVADDVALEEYDVQIDNTTRKAACYIASETGKVRTHSVYMLVLLV